MTETKVHKTKPAKQSAYQERLLGVLQKTLLGGSKQTCQFLPNQRPNYGSDSVLAEDTSSL